VFVLGFIQLKKTNSLFTNLLSPLTVFCKDIGANIDKKVGSSKLFSEDFFQKMGFNFQELRTLSVIDSSWFLILLSIAWTAYKSQSNACKLYLCLVFGVVVQKFI
jgi:hypothetical protein